MDYIKLSKELSYALRHAPWEYGLSPDSEGFVMTDDLLSAINQKQKYGRDITAEDIEHIIEHSDKKRLEINGEMIRALYGHSIPEKIEKTVIVPPDILYHGTPRKAVASIMKSGLKPMKRQYVHLSRDIATAVQVGSRRDSSPVILAVNAKAAHENGVRFYQGNDAVILADDIPPEYIIIQE